MSKAPIPVACQVRSKTASPCPRRAELEVLGVAFCGPCARKQEEYFAIGELTQEETDDPCGRALTEALKRMRRGGAGRIEGMATESHHGLSGVRETEPLALTNT